MRAPISVFPCNSYYYERVYFKCLPLKTPAHGLRTHLLSWICAIDLNILRNCDSFLRRFHLSVCILLCTKRQYAQIGITACNESTAILDLKHDIWKESLSLDFTTLLCLYKEANKLPTLPLTTIAKSATPSINTMINRIN